MARIYVSSTYRDLKDYREVVYRTLRQLRHDVSAMEDYVAAEERPLEKCLHDVASCDLYVGIFAFAYGYVPDQGNPERKSITELEYRKAGELGIPRLVFLVQEGAAWPTTLLDALGGEDGGRRIAALREDLKKEHTDSFFQSAEELARKVSIAVQQALGRMPAEAMQIDWEEPRRRFVDHMRVFAGARSGENAFRRYVSLPLQATRLEQVSYQSESGRTWSLTRGAFCSTERPVVERRPCCCARQSVLPGLHARFTVHRSQYIYRSESSRVATPIHCSRWRRK